MVFVSRELFDAAVHGRSCQFLLHPDDPKCTVALLNLGKVTLVGSAKYFFLMYLAQNALKYKTLTAKDIRPLLVSYTRSVLAGVWSVCSFIGVLCLYRKFRGKFDRDLLAYGPGIVSGLCIYIDDPRRRPIVAYTCSSLGMEALIRRLYRKTKRSNSAETLAFMILNAILMYKMRVSEHARTSRDIWFFRPPRVRMDAPIAETVDPDTGKTVLNACPHAETGCTAQQCFDKILKETSKYYVGALLFSATRLFLTRPNLRNSPQAFVKTMFQWKNMKLSCFFGWYVGVYQAVSCALCRWNKADKSEHALVAGFAAGLSYGLNKNLTILASLILYVARILGREFQEKYHLPKFHWVELSMILGITSLSNARLFDSPTCPGGFQFMLDMVSQNKMNARFDVFTSLINAQLAKRTST